MTILPIDQPWLPAAGAACAALLSALLLLLARRSTAQRERHDGARAAAEAALAAIRDEVRAQSATLITLAAKIDRLREDAKLREQHGAARAPGNEGGYELGIRMAAHGASPQEIVAACGLRPEDARLLLRLHGGARPSHAA